MTIDFTTENIDRLDAQPGNMPGRWFVTFQSDNDGMCHQLYVNGQLSDCTDTTEQRDFLVESASLLAEVAIAAVRPECRNIAFEHLLPTSVRKPGWIYRGRVVRSPAHHRQATVQLFTDRATGQMDSSPRLVRKIWPAWAPRWAWGEDPFGMGGFGYDGQAAPGLGKGAFGAAVFGIDADMIPMELDLAEDGTQQILLRTVTPEGNYADADIQAVAATPPPTPPASLKATQYDPQTQTLTIEIE